MNTIRSFFILCAVLFSTMLISQASINPAIQATLDGFIEKSNEHNWDKAFDYMYPRMFESVSKQDMVDMMKSSEADGMSLNLSNVRITSTSVPVEVGQETFVRVEYVSDMKVLIKKGGIYDYSKATTAMVEQFNNTYGTANVKWDEGANEFNIRASKSMMAINTNGDVWKIAEINMDQPQVMEQLFPAEVMDALVRVE